MNGIGFEQNRTKRVVNGDIITNTDTRVFPLLAVNMDKIEVPKVNTIVNLCETRTVHGIEIRSVFVKIRYQILKRLK